MADIAGDLPDDEQQNTDQLQIQNERLEKLSPRGRYQFSIEKHAIIFYFYSFFFKERHTKMIIVIAFSQMKHSQTQYRTLLISLKNDIRNIVIATICIQDIEVHGLHHQALRIHRYQIDMEENQMLLYMIVIYRHMVQRAFNKDQDRRVQVERMQNNSVVRTRLSNIRIYLE